MRCSVPERLLDPLKAASIAPVGNASEHLPSKPGIYIFWWIGDRSIFEKVQTTVKIKAGKAVGHHIIRLSHWYANNLPYIPLYVGKSVDVRKRVLTGHLRDKTDKYQSISWWLQTIFPGRNIAETLTSDCGISSLEEACDKEKIFLENMYIGILRPWFNLRSES